MGKRVIAACGNDCAACPRYVLPPYEKTAEQLRRTAQLWKEIGYRDRVVSLEEIACTGCSESNRCRYDIVRCVREKGLDNCGECGEYPCGKILECFERTMDFEPACRAACTDEEYAAVSRAFFEKRRNLEARDGDRQD